MSGIPPWTTRSTPFALISKKTILTGDIQVNTTGNVRGGQTAYDTGTGFWIGYTGGAYKFSIGNSAGNKLTWDGSTLRISGAVAGTIQNFASVGSDTPQTTFLSPDTTNGCWNWTTMASASITVSSGSKS